MKIRVGSRGSALALAQTEGILATLRSRGHDPELVVIQTAGDRSRATRYADIGAPGVFVREIESALLHGEIDLAVHSYKDLPSRSPDGLVVAAVPERLDPADVLVARAESVSTAPGTLPETVGRELPLLRGAVVGTSAERRRALLRWARPDLRLERIRGNVPTRLDKLRRGPYQALVLAAAGLERLRRAAAAMPPELAHVRLDPAVFVPSPAQGAIALQCREDDPVHAALAPLNDPAAALPVRAERALLRLVDGGCNLPFGAWAHADERGRLQMAAVIETQGRLVRRSESGDSPDELAAWLWELLQSDAGDLRAGDRGSDALTGRDSRIDPGSGAAEAGS